MTYHTEKQTTYSPYPKFHDTNFQTLNCTGVVPVPSFGFLYVPSNGRVSSTLACFAMLREAAAVPESRLITQGNINVLLISNKELTALTTAIMFKEKPALSRYTMEVDEYESTEACKISNETDDVQMSVARQHFKPSAYSRSESFNLSLRRSQILRILHNTFASCRGGCESPKALVDWVCILTSIPF
jgi:hypothetical protein